jgi:hypothetical protein
MLRGEGVRVRHATPRGCGAGPRRAPEVPKRIERRVGQKIGLLAVVMAAVVLLLMLLRSAVCSVGPRTRHRRSRQAPQQRRVRPWRSLLGLRTRCLDGARGALDAKRRDELRNVRGGCSAPHCQRLHNARGLRERGGYTSRLAPSRAHLAAPCARRNRCGGPVSRLHRRSSLAARSRRAARAVVACSCVGEVALRRMPGRGADGRRERRSAALCDRARVRKSDSDALITLRASERVSASCGRAAAGAAGTHVVRRAVRGLRESEAAPTVMGKVPSSSWSSSRSLPRDASHNVPRVARAAARAHPGSGSYTTRTGRSARGPCRLTGGRTALPTSAGGLLWRSPPGGRLRRMVMRCTRAVAATAPPARAPGPRSIRPLGVLCNFSLTKNLVDAHYA